MVSQDIVEKYQLILSTGADSHYLVRISANEVRECFRHMADIARWLFREADKSWPPKDSFRPIASGGQPASSLSSDLRYKAMDFFDRYKQTMVIGLAAVLVVAAIAVVAASIAKNRNNRPAALNITPTPTLGVTPITVPTPTPASDASLEQTAYLDEIDPTDDFKSFYRKEWSSRTFDGPFSIDGQLYEHGLGMFVPSASISDTRGSQTVKYTLDKQYSLLRFDLGVYDGVGYGADYGNFRIIITINGDTDHPVYDSGRHDYKFSGKSIEVDIQECDTMSITLSQDKGEKGTLNVIMGNALLVKAGAAASTGDTAASPSPTPTDAATSGSSPSPSPSPSPRPPKLNHPKPGREPYAVSLRPYCLRGPRHGKNHGILLRKARVPAHVHHEEGRRHDRRAVCENNPSAASGVFPR
jgi:hypothetical protein